MKIVIDDVQKQVLINNMTDEQFLKAIDFVNMLIDDEYDEDDEEDW